MNMNQRLKAEQLHQLDNNQKEMLRKQWTPEEGHYIALGDHEEMVYYLNGVEKHKALPLLSIGQMMEYLVECDASFTMNYDSSMWQVSVSGHSYQNDELCDVLWEAMKQIL
ncbi:hypothetical protein [Paenibacillus sp. SI8]|uniref:hypothetical protein n=1 Tax=unclassified Paenibacillus TaxID=185978 RepID=UPI0034676229